MGKTKTMPNRTIWESFWDKVDRTNPEACWLWKGSRFPNGYGQCKMDGKAVGAHRIAYQLVKGRIPEGLLVCHTCDNPSCCNPIHLFLGTALENQQDMVQKGRSTKGRRRPGTGPQGTRNSHAVLGLGDVALIRIASGSTRTIAAHFGISKSQVHNIRSGAQWKPSGSNYV